LDDLQSGAKDFDGVVNPSLRANEPAQRFNERFPAFVFDGGFDGAAGVAMSALAID